MVLQNSIWKKLSVALFGAAGVVALLAASPAQAVPLTWTFQNVNLVQDGYIGSVPVGTLTGSFVYDADLGLYSSVNIAYNATAVYSNTSFTNISGFFGTTFAQFTTPPNTPYPYLYLDWSAALTNAGGVAYITQGYDGIGFAPGQYANVINFGTSGLDTARIVAVADEGPVPEPATLTLLGAGLAGLGVLRRRKKA